VAELGVRALPGTGLSKEAIESIETDLDRVLHRAASNGRTS
jgi:hypothetical protein